MADTQVQKKPNTSKQIKHTLVDLIEKGKNYITEVKHFHKEIKKYSPKDRKRKRLEFEYNDDLEKLSYIIEPLEELNNMVGMNYLKNQVTDQILFFLQGFNTEEMMHTVIMGPPGCGKTTVAKILCKIYCELGFLRKGTFRTVGRSDLIGQYLGETAIKTKKVLSQAEGGVLFIDEAYSLGNPEGRDSYSKECIDTLNQYLSEHTRNFVCIIAGYEHSLEKCFFSVNEGLNRRFPWKYTIDKYDSEELHTILKYQNNQNSNKNKWSFEKDTDKFIKELLEKNHEAFSNNGGDTQIYLDKCRIVHARRVFSLNDEEKRILTKEDMENGMELFKYTKKIKEEKIPFGIYT